MVVRCLVICLGHAIVQVAGLLTSEKSIRQHLVANYDDALLRPPPRSAPTRVNLTFALSTLYGIDQQEGKYTMDIYFRAMWNDVRLAWGNLNASLDNKRDLLVLNNVHEHLWHPDLFFPNMITASDVGGNRGTEFYFKVSSNGDVIWSRRFNMDLECRMHFHRFPFDTQECWFKTETYASKADEIILFFTNLPGDNQFSTLVMAQWHDFGSSIYSGTSTFSTGVFPNAGVRFTMKRISSYWINSVLVPSLIFAFISYVGYWIDASAAPARIALSIICVLISVTSTARVYSIMPVVTYRVWLVDFMTGCVFFNLIAVVTYSIVNYGRTYTAHLVARRTACPDNVHLKIHRCARLFPDRLMRVHDAVVPYLVHLDGHMRWVFPLAFSIFLIVMFTGIDSYNYEES